MITAKFKIEPEILHKGPRYAAPRISDSRIFYEIEFRGTTFRRILRIGFKIIQRFVTGKIILLMALLLHKWLLLGYAAFIHPLFVSVTEINHNAQEKTLEISCKAFTDDLEKAIEKSANVKVDLFNVKDKAATEKAVAEYFKKHLVLKVDGKPVQMEFIGFER